MDLILANSSLIQHSNATDAWIFINTNVAAVKLGTDAFGMPLSAVSFNTAGNPTYLYDNSTGLSSALAVNASVGTPTDGYTLFIVNGNCSALDPTLDWTFLYSNVVAAA